MLRHWSRTVYWLVPPLICLAVYWYGLMAGFNADDFVWLQQRFRWEAGTPLADLLFAPTQHGTLRPLSERGYFLALSLLFPDDPLPFRIVAFATLFGAMALLTAIVRRVTGVGGGRTPGAGSLDSQSPTSPW